MQLVDYVVEHRVLLTLGLKMVRPFYPILLGP